MICDTSHDVGQPRTGIEIVQLGGDDQRVDGGSPLAALIRAAEQPRLPAQSHTAQRAFSGIVGQTDPAIIVDTGVILPRTAV